MGTAACPTAESEAALRVSHGCVFRAGRWAAGPHGHTELRLVKQMDKMQ